MDVFDRGVFMRFRVRGRSLFLIMAVMVLPAACGLQQASVLPASQTGALHDPVAASKIFALVRPGPAVGEVLVARATEHQPGGPETLVPMNVQPYKLVRLAPGAVIRITAPYYEGELTDH